MTKTPKQAAQRIAKATIRGDWKAEALHTYTSTDGTPIYWRIRARLANGEKWIRPMRLTENGYELGEPEFAAGKPLYRLHELAAHPGVPVWVVEGEKCADALAKLGVLATTAGSASSDERADFTPLASRAVTIWPDNDKSGIEHGERVAAKLRELGCRVELIDARALSLFDGGDCVDWIKVHTGATAADLAKLPRVRCASEQSASTDSGSMNIAYRRMSDVQAKPINWLWPGRIACGKLSMLAGNPGLGKSQVTASMAAIVTTGGAWPVDRTRCERGAVVFLSAEDDAEDTIRPRLEAAGADLARVFILDAVVEAYYSDGSEIRRAFNLKTDLARLSKMLNEIGGVALIVVDPITAYLGDADSYKNAEVRALLSPLSELAAKHNAAVVCVSHLNKGGSNDALMRVTGSLAFVAAARAAWLVARDQEDANRRLFLPLKNNNGNDQTGLAFAVQSAQVKSSAGLIETSRVVWEAEAVTVTADEAMSPQGDPEERSAVEDAKDFLRGLLADGPVPSKQVRADSDGAGHSWRTIQRAQKALGVDVVKGGLRGGWEWRLPPKNAKTPEECQEKTLAAFGNVGSLRQPSGTDPGIVEVDI